MPSHDGDKPFVTTVLNRDQGWGLEASGPGVSTTRGHLVGRSPLSGPCPSTEDPAAAGDPRAWRGRVEKEGDGGGGAERRAVRGKAGP